MVLRQPAERIVFIPMPGPATFIALDGSERKIVGMNSYSALAMRDGLLGELYPGYTKITTDILSGGASSFQPNIESILALKPDAVFQWASLSSDAISALDRAGLPVLGMRVGKHDEFAGSTLMMGKVAGKEERARALLARQDAVKRQIEAEMRDLAASDRPRVVYLSHATDVLRVAGKDSYVDFVVDLAGGRNVASDSAANGTVSIEQLLSWNPQVVLLGNFDKAMPADIYDDPRWQDVEAVKTRRVYRVPLGGYRWDPPSQESALGWLWLATLLHPERNSPDLRAAMRNWFDFLYQHPLNDAEIDRVLAAAANRQSLGYERFLTR